MSRMVRTTLPVSEELLHPESLRRRKIQDSLKKRQASQEKYYNAHTKKPLPELRIGESVRMKRDGKWYPAQVTPFGNTPRSYVVETSEGNQYRRNQRALPQTKIPAKEEVLMEDEQVECEDNEGQSESKPQRNRKPSTWLKDYVTYK
ncbi:hypothetical protein HOLleu_18843 [Holothuria leucospilota]|uniref:Uncharacterized protein n=1 Tax=Holothuria leucospilota TaxID=206669 RepID=A0A9Q1H9Z3_HOLLE|nr:hypothetical protein HOLleu_18843 [Holothuria leucospilota]